MADIKHTADEELKILKTRQVYDPRVIDENKGSQTLWTSESVDLAIKGLAEGYKLRENPFLKTVRGARLRKANIPFKYSEDELTCLVESMEDKMFYANNFGKLKDGNQGWVNITLRDYQEKLINQYTNNRWNLIMFPRQSGKTTTTIVDIAHFVTFNVDKDCVVIAQSDKSVNEILSKLKEYFAGLPFWLQPGFVSFNAKGFVLENGCRLSIGIASESVVQGFSLDYLYVDEAAYVKTSMWQKFWNNVYPTLINNPNSRCVITSTPNGRNHFYELWQGSILGLNKFVNYRIYWQDVPGRNEQFKIDTISNLGITGWLMGFECNFDTQLVSVFHSTTQRILRDYQQKYENAWSFNNYHIGNKYQIKFLEQKDIKYDLKQDYFLITVDIAEGLDQDYSVLKIKKIEWSIENQRLEYTTIGMFRDNTIAVDDFGEYVLTLVQNEFNPKRIKVVVENNTYGGEFFLAIKNLRLHDTTFAKVDNQIFAKFYRKAKQDFEYGIRWNGQNKSLGVKSFVTLTTKGVMKEYNPISIEEYMNFGKIGETYKASYGHDDCVMPDVTCAHFIKSKDIYSQAFLQYVEAELRLQMNDEAIEIRQRKQEEERKANQQFTWRGFHERDSVEELKKQSDVAFENAGIMFI